MTAPKFTPGPLAVKVWPATSYGPRSIAIMSGEHVLVATLVGQQTTYHALVSPPLEQLDANGHLFAAAPEGYEISKKLFELFGWKTEGEIKSALGHNADHLAQQIYDLVALARKHIAKSEGR